MTETPVLGWTPPSYDDVVETCGLEILMVPGDFSIVNGDLPVRKTATSK